MRSVVALLVAAACVVLLPVLEFGPAALRVLAFLAPKVARPAVLTPLAAVLAEVAALVRAAARDTRALWTAPLALAALWATARLTRAALRAPVPVAAWTAAVKPLTAVLWVLAI